MGGRRGVGRSLRVPAALLLSLAVGVWWAQRGSSVVFEGEGKFGTVRVIERRDGLRELYAGAGRVRQSAVYPDAPRRLELAYSRTAMVGPALVEPDARILFVGLGGGAMPSFVRQVAPQARIDVVEIDPLIVRAASEWFGFRTDSAMTVHTDDGRALIERSTPRRWDLVVLDAFSDTDIPRALTTREFLQAVRRSLATDGVVVSNLHTSAAEYGAMVQTYTAVFPTVFVVPVPARRQVILLATSRVGADEAWVRRAARTWTARVEPGFDLGELVRETHVVHSTPGASVLADGDPAR